MSVTTSLPTRRRPDLPTHSAAGSKLVFDLLDQGRELRHIRPVEARAHLQRARTLFAARGDGMGELLCLAFLVETVYFEWDDLDGMGALCDAMLALLAAESDLRAAVDASLTLQARLAIALLVSGREPQRLVPAILRTHALMCQTPDVAEHALAAVVLLDFHVWHPAVLTPAALRVFRKPRCDDDQVPPMLRIWWVHRAIAVALGDVEPEVLLRWRADAWGVATAHGLTMAARFLDQAEAEIHLVAGNLPVARAIIDCMRLVPRPRGRLDLVHHALLECAWHLRAGHDDAALDCALAAQAAAALVGGLPPMQGAQLELIVGLAQLGAGRHGQAGRWLRKT